MDENEILQLILNEIKGMKQEINSMHIQQNDIQTQQNNMQAQQNDMQMQQNNMQIQISSMQTQQDNIQSQVDIISNETAKIILTLENTTNKNINFLVEGFSNTTEKLNDHEIRITELEEAV